MKKPNVINIIINKDNSYVIEFNDATKKRYYPKQHIEKMLLGLKEHPIKIDDVLVPIIIYNNINKRTITLHEEHKQFTKDYIKYLNVPTSVKYRPNKFLTYEDDDWQLKIVKRLHNYYTNGLISKQEYDSKMARTLK
tara:strand:- start:124 stop:534 length:411 start_codon:yes stop_codon:yes gene_type:complete